MGALAQSNYTDIETADEYVTATTTSFSTYCPESTATSAGVQTSSYATPATAFVYGTAAGTGVGPSISVQPFIGAASKQKISGAFVVVALGAAVAYL